MAAQNARKKPAKSGSEVACGSQPFSIDRPQVYQLDGVRSPQSLYAFVNSQLGDEQVSKLKVKQETQVKVLDGHLQSEQIAPG